MDKKRLCASLVAAAILTMMTTSLAPVLAQTTQQAQTVPTRNSITSPPQTTWNKTYGGILVDGASSIQQTSDGGYIVAGVTASFGAGLYDAWLVKTDSAGNLQWNKTYGGANWDDAYAVRETSDGGYILAGYTASFGAGLYDLWLAKTNSAGALVWNKTYGGTNNDLANSVEQTSDGGYIAVGYTESFGPYSGTRNLYLVKTNSAGILQWNKTYGGPGSERAYYVQQTYDGGYIVAGHTTSFGAGSEDFWVVKTNSTGSIQWNRTYGGALSEVAYYIQQVPDGYVVVGTAYSFGAGSGDFWLVKTDISGVQQWSRAYGGADWDAALCARQTSDGGYILAGLTKSFGAGLFDVWLVKTDSSGTQQWNKTYGGTSDDVADFIQQTYDGGYIVAGYTYSFGAGSMDLLLLKISAATSVGGLSLGGLSTELLIAAASAVLLIVVLAIALRKRRKGKRKH